MEKSFYVVRKGRIPGIYETWDECKAQVTGFKGAEFKGADSRAMAEHMLEYGWEINPRAKKAPKSQETSSDYIRESISVDAACSGNPGVMEYQGVDTDTGEQIFLSRKYPVGTNNIGEFLAIVHALRYLHEKGSDMPIYSDSVSAIAWVRNKHVKTNLIRNQETEALWQHIDLSIKWLYEHTYENPILKWETKQWGEVKADFGRK